MSLTRGATLLSAAPPQTVRHSAHLDNGIAIPAATCHRTSPRCLSRRFAQSGFQPWPLLSDRCSGGTLLFFDTYPILLNMLPIFEQNVKANFIQYP